MTAMEKRVRMGLMLVVLCALAAVLQSVAFAAGAAAAFGLVSLNMSHEERAADRWKHRQDGSVNGSARDEVDRTLNG